MAEVLPQSSHASLSMSQDPLEREIESQENPNLKAANIAGFTPQEAANLLVYAIPEGMGDYRNFHLAYGRRAIPKLVFELSQALEIRQKALISLADLLRNPESIAQALHENVVDQLTLLLKEKDLLTRQKTSQCFSILSTHDISRTVMVQKGTMFEISAFFNDADPLVRKNSYNTCVYITSNPHGVQNVLAWSCVPLLVNKLVKERFDMQVLILDALYNCIRRGKEPFIPKQAIDAEALSHFTTLLSNQNVTDVKVGAAKCIMALCFYPEAKKLCTQGKTIVELIKCLRDIKSSVRAASAGALMSISINVEAKKQIVRENAIAPLIILLHDTDESVLLNAVKCITNCAEDYRGRFQLHNALKRLEELKNSSNIQLAEAANQAIKIITWRP